MTITKKEYQTVSLTAIGGALEFYDFTIYALFAPYLSHHFFSQTNPIVALMNTFAVFALGYFARPIGGIVFGHLGDKLGRKYAFSLAIFLMATSTLLMGCLPDYSTIGIMAPLLLLVLRLTQGFSVGGEIPGATLFTLEHVTKKHRGFAVSLIFMCITLGNTLGAGVGLILTTNLSQDAMMDWGWRVPFILGFLLGIISFIIRIKSVETPAFISMARDNQIHRIPFLVLMKTARKQLFYSFLLTAISASIISFFLYLPTYLSAVLHVQISYAYLINLISFLMFAVMTGFWGWISDYGNRITIMKQGAILLLLLSYPLFYSLAHHSESWVWLFILIISLLGGMLNGCYAVIIAELFPINIRYSGMGLSFSLGMAIFCGLAPLCFTYLIKILGNTSPAYYILLCSVLTLISIGLIQKNERTDLSH